MKKLFIVLDAAHARDLFPRSPNLVAACVEMVAGGPVVVTLEHSGHYEVAAVENAFYIAKRVAQ